MCLVTGSKCVYYQQLYCGNNTVKTCSVVIATKNLGNLLRSACSEKCLGINRINLWKWNNNNCDLS